MKGEIAKCLPIQSSLGSCPCSQEARLPASAIQEICINKRAAGSARCSPLLPKRVMPAFQQWHLAAKSRSDRNNCQHVHCRCRSTRLPLARVRLHARTGRPYLPYCPAGVLVLPATHSCLAHPTVSWNLGISVSLSPNFYNSPCLIWVSRPVCVMLAVIIWRMLSNTFISQSHSCV